MKSVICLLAFVVFPGMASAGIDDGTLRDALREANRSGDAVALARIARRLRENWPGHPQYALLQARGEALQGDADAALATLRELTTRGVDPLTAVEDDEAFAKVRVQRAFADLRQAAEALRAPVGDAERAWTFGDTDTIPEAVALAQDRVLLGSVRHGEVLVRNADGGVERWYAPGRWSVQGMHLEPGGRYLWAAMSAMHVSHRAPREDRGRSALIAIDTRSGKTVSRHELDAPGEHVLGDFIFLDNTTLLATDSLGGGVYALDISTGEYTERVPPGLLRSPQGLARIGDAVYIADYGKGLYRLDLATNALGKIDDGPAAPYGIDGLYVHDGALIAIQNGVRPMRVARFTLSEDGSRIAAQETLLANHADFQEPTLGMVDDDRLLLVANSQWNRFDRDGRLQQDGLVAPVILALALSRMPGS